MAWSHIQVVIFRLNIMYLHLVMFLMMGLLSIYTWPCKYVFIKVCILDSVFDSVNIIVLLVAYLITCIWLCNPIILSDIQEFYEVSLQDNENKPTEPSSLKTREPFPPVNEWNLTGPTETVPSANAQSKEVSRILMCMLPLRTASLLYALRGSWMSLLVLE